MTVAARKGHTETGRGLDRLLARLSVAPSWIVAARDREAEGAGRAAPGSVRLIARRCAGPGRGQGEAASPAGSAGLVVDADLLRLLAGEGLVERGPGAALHLSQAGRKRLKRAGAGEDRFLEQHRETGTRRLPDGGSGEIVTVNHAESPLAWLRNRKSRDGRPLIDAAQFEAGERLRSDHAFGQIVPGMRGMAWSALGSGAGGAQGGGGRGGLAELSDMAIAARRRLERALADVGPELAGVLVDVCCDLKGLEQVERARGWPPRSAKVILSLGLTRLARHYGCG
ncbi:DUF6456 domain-containing protein [Stappia sp.]|uniref:DUF6456 domain-containing protein n=1 Tax=Stappia sp. TaxID=1870903 RepID=UPI003D0B1518